MQKFISFLIAVLLFPTGLFAQSLEKDIQTLTDNFNGTAGVYVYHFPSGIEIAINADTLFPTASMIKIPIMLTVFDRIARDEITLDSTLYYYSDSIHYPYKGGDALSRFQDGEDITLGKLMAHMLTFSDNHASLWLQELAGSGTAINTWLDNHGFTATRMNSRTPGRENNWERYGWGQTTPREMAQLLRGIYDKRWFSPFWSETMYRFLCRTFWDGEALSQIPPYVQVASKQGAVSASRSEVCLVNAPHGDYLFCVITKSQKDVRWTEDNEGYVLIRNISRLLWNSFEPDHDWQPPELDR